VRRYQDTYKVALWHIVANVPHTQNTRGCKSRKNSVQVAYTRSCNLIHKKGSQFTKRPVTASIIKTTCPAIAAGPRPYNVLPVFASRPHYLIDKTIMRLLSLCHHMWGSHPPQNQPVSSAAHGRGDAHMRTLRSAHNCAVSACLHVCRILPVPLAEMALLALGIHIPHHCIQRYLHRPAHTHEPHQCPWVMGVSCLYPRLVPKACTQGLQLIRRSYPHIHPTKWPCPFPPTGAAPARAPFRVC